MDQLNLLPLAQEIVELGVGETERYNHSDCPAGEDTRRRLYITRPRSKPDSVLAFCHNCQSSGFVRDSSNYRVYRNELHNPHKNGLIAIHDDVSEPEGLIRELKLWPTKAQGWIFSQRLTQTHIDKYNIGYDPSTNRIYLPRYDAYLHGKPVNLTGYQLRKVEHRDNGPKYLTAVSKNDKGYTNIRPNNKKPCDTIIVEDLISGIHIAEAVPNVTVIVNYGVRVNIEALHNNRDAPHFLVWLDNDNPTVINQAKTMARTWGILAGGKAGYHELDLGDPKHYTSLQIKSTIDRFFGYDG